MANHVRVHDFIDALSGLDVSGNLAALSIKVYFFSADNQQMIVALIIDDPGKAQYITRTYRVTHAPTAQPVLSCVVNDFDIAEQILQILSREPDADEGRVYKLIFERRLEQGG